MGVFGSSSFSCHSEDSLKGLASKIRFEKKWQGLSLMRRAVRHRDELGTIKQTKGIK